jgi:hypothetical protein
LVVVVKNLATNAIVANAGITAQVVGVTFKEQKTTDVNGKGMYQ